MADYNTVNDSIVLGSGELYLAYMKDLNGIDLNDDSKLIPHLTMVGAIEGGAAVNYKPTFLTVQADNRGAIYLRDEDQATFKTGALNFSPENVAFVMPAISKSISNGTKLTIGGSAADSYLFLRFIHTELDGRQIILDMKNARCINGSSFTFDRTKVTTLDMQFTTSALPMNNCKDGVMDINFIDTDKIDNLPTVAVSNMQFTDTNTSTGTIAGTLTWTAPDSETNVTGYNVYLLDSDNRKVGDALENVNVGVDTFTIPNTVLGGATQLAIFAYNGYGESKYSTKLAITDVKA